MHMFSASLRFSSRFFRGACSFAFDIAVPRKILVGHDGGNVTTHRCLRRGFAQEKGRGWGAGTVAKWQSGPLGVRTPRAAGTCVTERDCQPHPQVWPSRPRTQFLCKALRSLFLGGRHVVNVNFYSSPPSFGTSEPAP